MATKKIKILITGSSGFIGENLIPLLEKDYGVYTWDLVEGNDLFEDEIEEWIHRVDVVIHLAAMTNVEGSKKYPQPFYKTNVLGTARIVALCHQYKKKLIYPSTLHVNYPDRSPYADSKRVAEEIVKAMMPFTPTTVLRLFNVYGPNMNNNSGSIINLFLKSKEVEVWGAGEAKRDYINVKDVASIIKAAISDRWNGKLVEVGTGKGVSLGKVAKLFAKYRKVPLVYKKAKEIEWPVADTKMLKKLYKKKLVTNLEEDIKELC